MRQDCAICEAPKLCLDLIVLRFFCALREWLPHPTNRSTYALLPDNMVAYKSWYSLCVCELCRSDKQYWNIAIAFDVVSLFLPLSLSWAPSTVRQRVRKVIILTHLISTFTFREAKSSVPSFIHNRRRYVFHTCQNQQKRSHSKRIAKTLLKLITTKKTTFSVRKAYLRPKSSLNGTTLHGERNSSMLPCTSQVRTPIKHL